ncbi:flippase [Chelativorans sp. YIM 93263]|uniref:flippase n=1 Tax=Chelativorans sp. YIM 93263 TaxID=2906648 RepID=UPI002379C991|nr:flippase [Chelativorans sp. YIM 93263]
MSPLRVEADKPDKPPAKPTAFASAAKHVRKLFARLSDANSVAAFVTLAVRTGGAGVGFLSHIFFARLLGTQGYGLFSFAWTWVIILGTLSHLGLSTSATRFVAQYVEKHRLRRAQSFTRFASIFVFLFGCLVAAAFMAVTALVIGEWYASPDFAPLVVAAACIPVFAMGEMLRGVARGFGWNVLAYSPSFLERPLVIITLTLLVVVAGVTVRPETLMIISLVALLTTLGLQWLRIARRTKDTSTGRMHTTHGRYWLATSAPLVFVDAYYLIISHTDIVILKAFVSDAEIAVYFAAAKIAALVFFFQMAAGSAAARPFAQAHTNGDNGRIADLSRQFALWSFLPTLACAIFLVVLGKQVLHLFGPDFTSGYPVLVILLSGLVVQAAIGPVRFAMAMTGLQKSLSVVMAVSALANIAMNVVLIPRLGAIGAAVATAISTVGFSITLAVIVRARLGFWPWIFAKRRG